MTGLRGRLAIVALSMAPVGTALGSEAPPRVVALDPQNVVSVHVLSLLTGGFGLQGERYTASHAFSLIGGVGMRSTAGGDYSSLAVDLAFEVRGWIPFLRLPARFGPLRGPYLSARIDLDGTRTVDRVRNRSLGTQVSLSGGAFLGYRVAFLNRLEVTPAVGYSVRIDSADPVPGSAVGLGTLTFGLTVGYSW